MYVKYVYSDTGRRDFNLNTIHRINTSIYVNWLNQMGNYIEMSESDNEHVTIGAYKHV